MKKIALIGSTGSIGRQVLKVVQNHPQRFKIAALVANTPSALFQEQAARFSPEYTAVVSQNPQAALRAATLEGVDVVFNAAGGFAGLEYSIAALKSGKTLALANKETLVCGGDLVMGLGGTVIPVDSEHSAIWQCVHFNRSAQVRRLIITASGGAFRGRSFAQLQHVTPQQALLHPTWQMGKKITVDSATLMNKGYEVIEAHVLYGTPYSNITAVIQPQSIVHSMVEFNDGAILAQLSYPTMELPIQLALTYPERLTTELAPMDFGKPFSLEFEPLERKKYPMFDLALTCGELGGTLPCALNGADEVAVQAFMAGKISFTDMFRVVDEVISRTKREEAASLEQLTEADRAARAAANTAIKNLTLNG